MLFYLAKHLEITSLVIFKNRRVFQENNVCNRFDTLRMSLVHNKIEFEMIGAPFSKKHSIDAARSKVKGGTGQSVVNGKLVTTKRNGMKW